MLLGGLVTLPMLAAVAAVFTDGRWPAPHGWLYLTVGMAITSSLLPTAVTAWRWRSLD